MKVSLAPGQLPFPGPWPVAQWPGGTEAPPQGPRAQTTPGPPGGPTSCAGREMRQDRGMGSWKEAGRGSGRRTQRSET